MVDADADRLDDALRTQFVERRIGAVHRLLEAAAGIGILAGAEMDGLVGIVDRDHVDIVGVEALQRAFERTHHGIARIVELGAEGAGLVPQRRLQLLGRDRHEVVADLRRDDDVGAGQRLDRQPQPRLADAEAIDGRGVEIADAIVIGRLHRVDRRVGIDGAVHIAEPGAAEPDRRHLQAVLR